MKSRRHCLNAADKDALAQSVAVSNEVKAALGGQPKTVGIYQLQAPGLLAIG